MRQNKGRFHDVLENELFPSEDVISHRVSPSQEGRETSTEPGECFRVHAFSLLCLLSSLCPHRHMDSVPGSLERR